MHPEVQDILPSQVLCEGYRKTLGSLPGVRRDRVDLEVLADHGNIACSVMRAALCAPSGPIYFDPAIVDIISDKSLPFADTSTDRRTKRIDRGVGQSLHDAGTMIRQRASRCHPGPEGFRMNSERHVHLNAAGRRRRRSMDSSLDVYPMNHGANKAQGWLNEHCLLSLRIITI